MIWTFYIGYIYEICDFCNLNDICNVVIIGCTLYCSKLYKLIGMSVIRYQVFLGYYSIHTIFFLVFS